MRKINKVIGVTAHVDAGKTTFFKSLMYHSKTIRNKGRVDHHNFHLDTHPLEKKRGITIFTDQALLYKISHDQDHNRISHIKVLAGSLKVREELEYQNVDQVAAGEIAGVLGLSEARAGTVFGQLSNLKAKKHQTALKSKVIYAEEINTRKLLEAFKILDAEVHLKIEAASRNSGIIFENKASTDDLSRGLQNLRCIYCKFLTAIGRQRKKNKILFEIKKPLRNLHYQGKLRGKLSD